MIYEDFCKVYRDELPSYDYIDEIGDDVSELVIGQLYGAKYPGEVVESPSEAIFILANEIRKTVTVSTQKPLCLLYLKVILILKKGIVGKRTIRIIGVRRKDLCKIEKYEKK